MAHLDDDGSMPIAVIGMGCRFPGDATSPEKLWEMLAEGRSAWTEFPEDRINIDGFYHPGGERQGTINFRGGHFMKEDLAAWDAPFFSMTSAEAAAMDPQQRILLEVSYEALENAGIRMETLPGSATAVYCGSFVKDYEQICLRDPDDSPQYAATGNGIAIMSNRVSWFYDLRGPSLTLDTGCSASLVGLHLACQSIRTGESTMAIAMGAGMILTPSTMLPMTALNFLSKDGKCFSFDERANGYGRGEGIAAVILKPLKDALRDNDTIRAVIRGSGVNQDGRTPGITMPSAEAQALNIRRVYKEAGLGMNETQYFEAHGTGTQAGDPIELGAIGETFATTRDTEIPLYVGSVKTNIGHLEGCAGLAGLIKSVLILEKGLIPQNLWFENVNPRILLDDWRIKIPTALTPWPTPGLRRVSVNCFGFGGTNAHIILDDALHYMEQRGIKGKHTTIESPPLLPLTPESVSQTATPETSQTSYGDLSDDNKTTLTAKRKLDTDNLQDTSREGAPQAGQLRKKPKLDGQAISKVHDSVSEKDASLKLFVLTAHEQSGIARQSEVYGRFLEAKAMETPDVNSHRSEDISQDLAYTLSARRSLLPWRAFIVAPSINELSTSLLERAPSAIRSTEIPRVAFVFSGQGAQYHAMGTALMGHRVFAESLRRADSFFHDLGAQWSLIDELLKTEAESLVDQPYLSQPLCTALQVALVDLLADWNVKPTWVVGHSSGEIAAAYCIGVLSRESAWTLAYHRGRIASSLVEKMPDLRGKMMAVALSPEQIQPYIAKLETGKVVVACINSPENVTISGDESAILELQQFLKEDGVFARLLKVEIGYHSHHMLSVHQEYLDAIADLQPIQESPGVKMFSSVYGSLVSSADLGSEYWATNLVSPVRFSEAVQALLKDSSQGATDNLEPDVFLEVGPHAVLQSPLRQILEVSSKQKSKPAYLSMLHRKRNATSTAIDVAGQLWMRGAPVSLRNVNDRQNEASPKVLSDLPPYPWNHTKTYWHESHLCSAHRFRKHGRQDLIGAPTADSTKFEPRWRGFIRVSENPWVMDHQIQNTVLYPASGMIVMVIEAARQMADETRDVEGYELGQVKIGKAIVVPQTAAGIETALNIRPQVNDSTQAQSSNPWYDFTIYSWSEEEKWQVHCTGTLSIRYRSQKEGSSDKIEHAVRRKYKQDYAEAQEICTENVTPRQVYETLETIGLKYGPLFQNITSIRKKNNISCTTIRIPATLAKMPHKFEYPHLLHPATLDALFQTLVIAGGEPMVPTSVDSIYVSASLPQGAGAEFKGHSNAEMRGLRQAVGNIIMSDSDWEEPKIVVRGFHCTTLTSSTENMSSGGFLANNHNLCAQLIWKEDVTLSPPGGKALLDWIDLLAYKNPEMSILEIGSGSGNLAHDVLQKIAGVEESAPRFTHYCISDLAATSFDDVKVALALWSDRLDFKNISLDIEPKEQNLMANGYDLVIYSGDSIDDGALPKFVSQLTKFLRVGGTVIINPVAALQINASDDTADMAKVLRESGFSNVQSVTAGEDAESREVVVGNLSVNTNLANKRIAILTNRSPSDEVLRVCSQLENWLSTSVESITSGQFDELEVEGQICIVLSELDSLLPYDWDESKFLRFKHIVAQSAGCLWLTSGGQMNISNPGAGLITGLFRTIRSEDPQRSLFQIDISDETDIISPTTTQLITSILSTSFGRDIAPEENEYAISGGNVFVPRIILEKGINAKTGKDTQPVETELQLFTDTNRPLKLEAGNLGRLESLRYSPDALQSVPLRESEIRIAVAASGVSLQDVKTALGQTTSDFYGRDAAGIVIEVGAAVTRFKMGDRVIAYGQGTVKTLFTTEELLVYPIPEEMSFETATSFVSAFMVAYHALVNVGQLRADESVLIPNASGAVGQAALQVAQHVGAQIYATVRSAEIAGQLCKTYGLKAENVFDSHSSKLAAGIKHITEGRGVDLVLNSAEGEAMRETWACTARFGRFIDISKGAEIPNLLAIAPSVSYTAVDIDQLSSFKPKIITEIFQAVCRLVQDGTIRAISPINVFKYSEISAAFNSFALPNHQGKVVLSVAELDLVSAVQQEQRPLQLNGNSTYVLVGGLGGLGRSITRLLIEHGARNIAFISRSGAATQELQAFVNGIRQDGCNARAYACDICDSTALEATIKGITTEMPPIKGVLQAAAVIRDGIFENMPYEDWKLATSPKVQGSWNLHKALPEDMDFFVFLSSSAGVIGARGQGNYATGNVYEDALAHYRRARGLPAVALDLGLILGAGMVAEDEQTLDILRASGFFGISEKDFHVLVSSAITGYSSDDTVMPPQLIVGTGTGGLVQQNGVSDAYWYREAKFAIMRNVDVIPSTDMGVSATSPRALLAAASSLQEARDLVLEGLTTLLAKSMSMLPEDMDTAKPANVYGVDSLVAVGTRNWIYRETGVDVSVFEILSDVSLKGLADIITRKCKYVAKELIPADDQ